MSQLSPALFFLTVAASTRQSVVSTKFFSPFIIDKVRISFALNAQRLLRVSAWVVQVEAVANNSRPAGINLLADTGTVDYIVGSGNEGEIILPLNRRFESGRICLECNNTDSGNSHAIDARFDLLDG